MSAALNLKALTSPKGSYTYKQVPEELLSRLMRFGGPELVAAYLNLWDLATEPNYPCGFLISADKLQVTPRVQTLYELNLLTPPNAKRDAWLIVRSPGYEGNLRRIRVWGRIVTE